MGYDTEMVDCGIRVSIGAETTKKEIESFVREWSQIRNEQCVRVA
jgi:cysteine sulfinate desulfinase/cysteine desulfurase-like protein